MTVASEPRTPSVVVLQHGEDAPPGLLIDVLETAGLRSRTVRVDLGEPLPDPASLSLAVTLGRGSGVEEREPAEVTTEIDWLREADRSGTAVLGVGSGAQALATALGGGVQRALRARHGWVWISSSIPAWISPGPWLAWQEDVIRLPPKARLLAHDRIGPQAYLVNGHLGLQFHPEVTPKILCDWITSGHAAGLDSQGVLEATSREYATASEAGHRLLSTYIHSLANRRR